MHALSDKLILSLWQAILWQENNEIWPMQKEMFCARCPDGNSLCRLRRNSGEWGGQKPDQKPNQERIQSFLTALEERMKQDYVIAYPLLFSDSRNGIDEGRTNKEIRKIEKRRNREDNNKNFPGIRKKINCIKEYLLADINIDRQEDNEVIDDEVTQGKGYLLEVLICEMIRYLLYKNKSNFVYDYDVRLAFPQIDFVHHLNDHNQGGDILFLSCDESGKPINPIAIVDVTMQPVDKLNIKKLWVGKFQRGGLIIPVYNVPLGLTDKEKEASSLCRNFLNPVRLELCSWLNAMDGFLFSEEVLKAAEEVFKERFLKSIMSWHETSFDNEAMRHTGKKNVNPDLQAKSEFFVEFANKLFANKLKEVSH